MLQLHVFIFDHLSMTFSISFKREFLDQLCFIPDQLSVFFSISCMRDFFNQLSVFLISCLFINHNKGGKFLKKLWCCVGGENICCRSK